MRTLVKYYCFGYGCLGACASLLLYCMAFGGYVIPLNNVWVVELVFAIHALAMIGTFQRTAGRRRWAPMVNVTPGRIQSARLILLLSTLNFMGCFVCLLVSSSRGEQFVSTENLEPVLISFLLLNTLYIAFHRAYRPENLFSEKFSRMFTDPLGSFLRAFK